MLKGRGISVAHVCVREREWEREGGQGEEERDGEGRERRAFRKTLSELRPGTEAIIVMLLPSQNGLAGAVVGYEVV